MLSSDFNTCDPSPAEIFRKLDVHNSGSIELDFSQVRTHWTLRSPDLVYNCVFRFHPGVDVSVCVCVCLQWLNFAMIWAVTSCSPRVPVLTQHAIFLFTDAASLQILMFYIAHVFTYLYATWLTAAVKSIYIHYNLLFLKSIKDLDEFKLSLCSIQGSFSLTGTLL